LSLRALLKKENKIKPRKIGPKTEEGLDQTVTLIVVSLDFYGYTFI